MDDVDEVDHRHSRGQDKNIRIIKFLLRLKSMLVEKLHSMQAVKLVDVSSR